MDSGNMKVSHAGEPGTQLAAIANTTLRKNADGTPKPADDPTRYNYVANGLMDGVFSDTVDLPFFTLYRGLTILTAGDIKFNDWDGNTIGPVPVPIGVFPWRVRRIFLTGTTCSNVIGIR